jgi:predicted metal-dependent phosphoesterase TrpH
VYVDYLYVVDMDAAVKLIRDAGGVAVVAHWYTVARKIDAPMLEGMIRDGRLDGVEIMGNPLNTAARRAEPVLRAMAERTGCLATYGVDGHRADDLRNFVSDRELARRTSGQTARLIEQLKPDTSYSNL